MRDQITNMGTQSMCALYKPETVQPAMLYEQHDSLYGPAAKAENQPSSNSGSEAEWEPDAQSSKYGKINPEHSRLKVRDKGRSVQRRWRQKFKVCIPNTVLPGLTLMKQENPLLTSAKNQL